jgi:hypothetical protein
MISNNHIHFESPEEEADRYRRLYRTMLGFWLPLAAAIGVLVGHFLI